jgi:hypothetical protein
VFNNKNSMIMKEERLWSASRSMRTACRVSTSCESVTRARPTLDLIDLYLTYIYIIPVAGAGIGNFYRLSTTLLSIDYDITCIVVYNPALTLVDLIQNSTRKSTYRA